MLSNYEIVKRVNFLKSKLSLSYKNQDFNTSLLYNHLRYMGQSIYSVYFEEWFIRKLIKIERYHIANLEEIYEKEKQIMESTIFEEFPLYPREKEFNNLLLTYVYNNIDSNLTIKVGKEFNVAYTYYNFSHKVIANLFIEECNLIITKCNESFDDFFNLFILENTKLCIIKRDHSIVSAFIIEKTDIFNKHIKEFILTENEESRKKWVKQSL